MASRESRTARRERLLREAALVALPKDCDVTVVGGGAAGLVAAIVAAEAGASVVVLERDLECGRTILATGNGRCNFANAHLDPQRYNDPAFVEAVCGPDWLSDVLDFFADCGMRWCAEEDRLYPVSRQAASVRNVLLARARRAGVTLAPAREYRGPGEPLGGGSRPPRSRTVVLASGGGALPLVGNLGLRTAPRAPVLCPLACRPSPLAELDGRRVHARACLTKAGTQAPAWQEAGEVLFRSYGLSGIVVFDLSRRTEAGDLVELDLVPDLSEEELLSMVDPRGTGRFHAGCLDGVLDPVVAAKLEVLSRDRWSVAWPDGDKPHRDAVHTDASALVALAKALPLVVEGPADEKHAQVMRGGLCTDQFDPRTLASYAHPWLYACGEALDVDADCGGFNLAWAWKSGMVAGSAAT